MSAVMNPEGELARTLLAETRLAATRHDLVAQLRVEQGWTWTQIAAALGISKQGAAKVYSADADRALSRAVKNDGRGEPIEPAPRPSTPVAAPAIDVPLDLDGHAEARWHRCPLCGAPAGEACTAIDPKGEPFPDWYSHPERRAEISPEWVRATATKQRRARQSR